MEKRYDLPFQKFMLSIFLIIFSGLFTYSASAQQTEHPFTLELNAGGGLIGNSTTNTSFYPELGISYMPGRWGVGLNAALYSFNSGFSAEQYRTGFEEYTISEHKSDQWSAFTINAGPRFEQSLSRIVSLNLGLDLAMNYQQAPSQSVQFNDPTGEMESSGMDTDLVLAEMDGGSSSGWSAAIRPQIQLEFKPGFSDRFSFNIKTGIQHHLSDREITYTERDLSRVMQVDSPYEMHHQFENAPIVQRTESAPKTNFFANAGIKISFGGSSNRGLHPEGVIHRDIASRASSGARDYNSSRSNKPSSEADIGDGDPDSDGDGIDDVVETAQDYNSSRSNKPNPNRAADGGDGQILLEAITMARIVNPAGTIFSVGQVLTSTKSMNPLYEPGVPSKVNPGHIEAASEAESPLYEGQANNGDSGDDSYGDPVAVQRFDLQPSSYCVDLATVGSQPGMRVDAQSHNSSRSNRTEGVANPDLDVDHDSTDQQGLRIDAQSHNSSRSNRTEGVANPDLDVDHDSTDQQGLRIDAQSHNSSRSNRTEGVANSNLDGNDGYGQSAERAIPPSISGVEVTAPYKLKPDTGPNGFPEIMTGASLTVQCRKALGRMKCSDVTLERANDDLDSDGYDEMDGFQFNLEVDPLDTDDDGDGLGDVLENATFSISKRSARTGRSAAASGKEIETMEWNEGTARQMASDDDPCGPGVWARTTGGSENCTPENSEQENPLAQESGWQEAPNLEVSPPNDVYQWTYKLNALSDDEELPGNGTLTVLFTEGKWHFDVQVDPDDDGDGYGDLLQNSSFSISKRSARTGRNPQTGKEIH